MKNYAIGLVLVIGEFLSSSYVFAQPCLTAKPAPACRACFITEFGYGYKINPPLKRTFIEMAGGSVTYTYESEVTGRHYLTSELGYLYNLNAQYGLGFTHFTGWDVGHNLRGGLKLRLRRWLNPKTSLDLSGGAFLWGIDDDELQRSTFIGGASVNFSEWESVNLMIEFLQTQPYDYTYDYGDGIPQRSYSPQRRNVGVYLGYKLRRKFIWCGVILAANAMLSPRLVMAQVQDAGPAVKIGERVRVEAPEFSAKRLVGTVVEIGADSLKFEVQGRGLVRLPLRAITALEVSRGKKSNGLSGFGLGVLGGAAAGWAIFSIDHKKYDIDPRPYGAILGGAAGGLLGLIIGINTHTDLWEPVPVPKIRMGLLPKDSKGLVFSASWLF
jgi:hypothetical protein